MDIKPVNEFIPREIDPEIIPVLDFFSDMLSKFVDFGSNIFVWEDHSKNGEENIAPTMLLRHFFDLLDSLSVLVKNSCADPAKLLLRGMLETHFSIEYLLESDSYNRALAFFVEDVLAEISLVERMIELRDNQSGTAYKFRVDDKELTLDDVLKNKRIILHLPQFETIYNEFESRKGKSRYYPHWYQCFGGPKTIREIAKKLGKEDLYDNIYSTYSRSTHGTDVVVGRLSNTGQQADIIQIRRPTDNQQVSRFALYLANTTVQNYIEKRIPVHTSTYKKWFASIYHNVNVIMGKDIINVD